MKKNLLIVGILFSFLNNSNAAINNSSEDNIYEYVLPFDCNGLLKKKFSISDKKDISKVEKCLAIQNKNLNQKNLGNTAESLSDRFTTIIKKEYLKNAPKEKLVYSDLHEIKFPVGAIKIKLEGSDMEYIAAEAPLSADTFLPVLWKYDITTYVTINSTFDNKPEKLSVYRYSSENKTNLHYLKRMSSEIFNPQYKVYEYEESQEAETIQRVKVSNAIVAKLGQLRRVYQIQYDHWQQGFSIDDNHLFEIVKNTLKTYKSGPIYVNCFSGFQRTKTVILAIHAYILHQNGYQVNIAKIIREYDEQAANGNEQIVAVQNSKLNTTKEGELYSLYKFIYNLNNNLTHKTK